jgi:hypothetical protein
VRDPARSDVLVDDDRVAVRIDDHEAPRPGAGLIDLGDERHAPRLQLALEVTDVGERFDAGELRERWTDVQAGFVDEPKSAVEQADALVAEVMKRLADSFATERQALEQQWSRGDDASTEDLRVALRRYRSFFDRLLSI